jgi:hypothetical protein
VDDHVHVARSGANDRDLIDWCKAEGVHFANTVQMGDVQGLSFLQAQFGPASDYLVGDYLLHSAQEDPRTNERGHALVFGNAATHWDPSRYFIYEDVFDQTHSEGGLTGYAHNGSTFHADRGLAIDMPLGKVDFIELGLGNPAKPGVVLATALYDWWSLGYEHTVTSGSDFPFLDYALGRNLFYVHLDPGVPFTHVNVLEAIDSGRTYASSGPMVDFTVDGELPGSRLDRSGPQNVSVVVHARLNPTLGDKLLKIELISQGDIVATQVVAPGGEYDTTLTVTLPSTESRWIAAQVSAVSSVAHTTPVYLVIDGKSFRRADELSVRVPKMDALLAGMETQIANGTVPASQASALQAYIDQSRAILQGMLACPALTITALPPALPLGAPFADTLGSPNGYGPLLFFQTSGTLPTGLVLGSDGSLSGTPTVPGTFTFSVQVTDVLGCVGTQVFTVDASTAGGSACTQGAECASGFCADNVCCDAACAGGPCDACSVATGASADGTCTLLSAISCDDGDACSSGDGCFGGACVGLAQGDQDADGHCDPSDNCASLYNPSQLDTNGDGTGDACISTCVDFQRGVAGAVSDTHVRASQPTSSFGSAGLLAGKLSGAGVTTLLQVDLASLPVGAVVTSSTVTLRATATAGATLEVRRVTAPWSEAGATYANLGPAWDPVVAATAGNGAPTTSQPVSFGIAPLAQAWVDGTHPNYGLAIGQSGGTTTAFVSSEGPLSSSRPKVTVCYAVPEPANPCALPGATGSACDDGDPCTAQETCLGGLCQGVAATCDDGNSCTVDGCSPGVGCVSAPSAGACDDGNACTAGDTCMAGVCAGAAVGCDDGNPCTDDACDAQVGCLHAPNTAPCDDGDECSMVDTCAGGGCLGAPVGDLDADGACDAVDNCTAVYNPSQSDLDADDVGDACASTCVVLQRGGNGAVADAGLSSNNPSVNFGSNLMIQTNGTGTSSALLRFDLASLPATAQIFSSDLAILRSASALGTITLHRVTAPWSESTVTWSSFANAYDPAPTATVSNGAPVTNAFVSVDVTDLVQGWVTGTFPNEGVLLRQTGGVSTYWVTSEATYIGQRPELVVCYSIPEPFSCAVPGTDGETCDDADSCTSADVCQSGVCAGVGLPDGDADGVCDALDNCPDVDNPAQQDADGDGVGDACSGG